jgi:alkanesulfonate monooxygenase SsuD/methylene tetrahydromethanopterin reductase-like flavin-dependent oxidoreductase (luciferase family)
MEIATLRRLFGARAIVGIGHGVQDWMEQVGAQVASPMTLLREYTTALRALLNGETVTTRGRYVRLDEVALDWPPEPAPELLIGATGPKTLALSGELADGTILTGGTAPSGVRTAKLHIGTEKDHDLVVFVPAATGPGAAERLAEQQSRYGMDDPGVAGDARAVAAGLERWIEAGATTVVLQPTTDEPDPEGFLRFVAEEVRPLLS